MKKILSLILFGSMFLSFSCHTMAFAEGNHYTPAPLREITEHQAKIEVKNCCDSIAQSNLVDSQKNASPSLLVILPESALGKTEWPEVANRFSAPDPLFEMLSLGLVSTVKRE